MASSADLILGLVTHSHSGFRKSGERTLATVAESLQSVGIVCEIIISDRNDADPAKYPIDRSVIARSARHQAALEARWRRHLDHQWGGAVGDRVLTLAMAARRTAANPKALLRLLNIDLSHLRIWRTALTHNAPALVLEDDARLRTAEVGQILADLLPRIAHLSAMVNCSTSIDVKTLGAQNLLDSAPTTDLPLQHALRMPQRAVTNTVCANLYSVGFLTELVSFIDTRGLVPVVPIDWRVNEFLLENPDARTWWLDPPPFEQGSMID